MDADTKTIVANYIYSPFGVLVGKWGDAADECPFRFQSKYYDEETELYYFGYRYYDPASTKWLSRDPLGEAGGVNLTAFCRNDPVNRWDALGLLSEEETIEHLQSMKDDINLAAREFRVSARTIASIIYAETRYNVSLIDQLQDSKGLKAAVMWKGGGSIGPAQIKPKVAFYIEQQLHDPKGEFYIGQKGAELIPKVKGKEEMWERITGQKWSAMYVGAMLRMFDTRWVRVRAFQVSHGVWPQAPLSIAAKPDILATLYNLGFEKVVPKGYPQANEFGKNALQFYESDKLKKEFLR